MSVGKMRTFECDNNFARVRCCLCCSCGHRARHSFPARRSSDLADSLGADSFDGEDLPPVAVELAWDGPATGAVDARSEEHTSELQSQFHLVCRLLLEKKNRCSCSRFCRVCT